MTRLTSEQHFTFIAEGRTSIALTVDAGSMASVAVRRPNSTGTQQKYYETSTVTGIYPADVVTITAESGSIEYEVTNLSATYSTDPATGAVTGLVGPDGGVAAYIGSNFIRWCIPGKDTSGTLFKDVSGKGNNATIEASNTTPFAVDNRMSTVAHASAGGIVLQAAASAVDLTTDSFLMGFSLTNEDPAGSESVASWGAGGGGSNFAGIYISHRSSAAGVARIVANLGNGTLVSGSDTTVKISNAGGTRETHVLMAYDAPTRSVYLYRDGVLAASNAGLLTGGSAWVLTTTTLAARLGGTGAPGATVAGVFRGWQGYVFAGNSLPLNIGRVAALLAEAPSVPLKDAEFTFAA